MTNLCCASLLYISSPKSDACGSNIGYRRHRADPLAVTYSPYCLQLPGAIQHELLHVLGLLHEQSRPDRDEYVQIVWPNIEPQFVQNFMKADETTAETFGLPYDFESLMHYPTNAFARSSRNVTIFARVGLKPMNIYLPFYNNLFAVQSRSTAGPK